jgi:hypothetical protein
MRNKLLALLSLAVVISLSGAWNLGAVAAPDKEPDKTLNDHPSGKDKNQEPGGSSTQGGSTSDPDGNTNGGPDKPGGSGGYDDDKDGNNGCGNDDDFEDDNNGNCGGRRGRVAGTSAQKMGAGRANGMASGTATTPVLVTSNGTTKDDGASREALGSTVVRGDDTQVMGVSLVREPAAVTALSDTAVLGTTAVRSTSATGTAATLAATGAPILWLVALGLYLITLGGLLVHRA